MRILVLLLATLCGCQVYREVSSLEDPDSPAVIELGIQSLSRSIRPLRDAFNAEVGSLRLLCLLSSSCGPSEIGAQAVRDAVLAAHPDADIWVGIIWIDMLPSDCPQTVIDASRDFDDPRVHFFHDGQRRAGRAFAERLLPTAVAWDTYLFYAPGVEWSRTDPPRPDRWAHQLGRIEPEHYHPREKLVRELDAVMSELSGS